MEESTLPMEIIIALFLGLVCGLLALAFYLYRWHKKLRTNLAQMKFVPADPKTVKEGTVSQVDEEVITIQEQPVFTIVSKYKSSIKSIKSTKKLNTH